MNFVVFNRLDQIIDLNAILDIDQVQHKCILLQPNFLYHLGRQPQNAPHLKLDLSFQFFLLQKNFFNFRPRLCHVSPIRFLSQRQVMIHNLLSKGLILHNLRVNQVVRLLFQIQEFENLSRSLLQKFAVQILGFSDQISVQVPIFTFECLNSLENHLVFLGFELPRHMCINQIP